MKKLISIVVAAMLAVNLFAAEEKKAAPGKGGRGGFLKELGLSKEQAEQMKKLNADFAAKMKELSKEERKAKGREIQKERQAAVAKILTEEQNAKLKEIIAKRREAGKGKGKPEGKGKKKPEKK
tara:strand:- start:358 stop:729 length:372 start_codon:yes stop_codon:yes gene_type:complete